MKKNLAKIISIITVAPINAFITVTILYMHNKISFGSNSLGYILLICFLTLVPLSAYLLKYVIPPIRKQGRDGERKLAFIMCVTGYIVGTLISFLLNLTPIVKVIFVGYLFSGGILAFVNKVIKVKASGHACGITGPMTMLCYYFGWYGFLAFFLLPLVFWARLSMSRHTIKELVYGSIIGIAGTVLALMIII